MNVMRNVCRGVLVLACLCFLLPEAHAQYRASIQGVVTDPQGAVVSGATVTLKNQQTNQTLVATTNADGIYNFSGLPPSRYSVTVEKAGFKKKVLDNVGLIAEQANALNIQLELGAVTESVTVSGNSTPLIDTQTASINGSVTDNQIQSLPSFGRDVLKVAQLAPGVFGDGAQGGNGSGFNIPGTQTGGGASGGADGIFKTENGAQIISNGQQTENNGIYIDGISTTSAVWGGSTVVTPSVDSVQEVKIVSNDYDAEYGRFGGASIQIISKSGTNNYHGSAFITTHQPNLNAYQRFNGFGSSVTRDNNKFEQFGGTVGGPIWKNKIFAFFSYEGEREPFSSIQGNGWYDTPAFDALAPAGSIAATYLSFPGNGVVGTLNPNATCATAGLTEGVNCQTIPGQGINVGTPLTTGLGTQDMGWTSSQNPGCGGAGTGCGTAGSPLGTVADLAQYNTVNPTTISADQYNGRLDANITEKDQISYAMYWVPYSKDNYNGQRAYDIFHHSQINDAFSALWNHTFSPSFLNEARANAAGWRWNEITSNPQSPVGLPSDGIGQIGGITPNSFGPNVGSILNQWTYTFKDVATKIYGRHTIKFGGELTRLFYLQNCTGCGVPNYSFFNIWDFLNDAPHQEGGGFDPHTGFPTTERQDQREAIWGLFAQDDFKLRPNLTLNLGLRWSYFGPLSAKQGNMYAATPGAGADYLTGLNVALGHSWNPQKDNFGPQIGFAWSPTSLFGHQFNNRLVVRGGYGLDYNQEEFAISANISNNPGLIVFPSLTMATPNSPNPGILYAVSSGVNNLDGYPSNPNTISTFGPNGLPTTGTANAIIFPKNLPTMRMHHWSLETQYDLGHDFVATVGYQGSLSRDIFFHENPLAVPAAQGYPLNPQIGGGDYWGVSGRGNYNALLTELNHRFSKQFLADAQFTWSKCMDTSSGPYFEQPYPYDVGLDYGRCDYNVGKAFKLYGMWQPVFFHGSNNLLEKIAGGWSISGIFNLHSGFPWSPVVSVQGGSLYCGQCGYGTLFPAAYLGGAGSSTSNSAFETAANSNFPNGGAAYFSVPTYTAYSGTNSGTALPQTGVARNSFTLPGYKDVDLTLSKSFGLPKAPILGEDARIQLRVDAYNLFNNLNLDPTRISNNIASSNFGTITGALAGRVVTLGARFSF
ncbi:MAG TPA: carboxypeptidase regulatory-like domain-containing protein [Candidatus Acidoferrum sp.]|nr:carboxypeptidase regulatory-like domain-containing protein [Candidatus Acidoferrum sp.]